LPHAGRGAWGTGSIHHIAWRVDDEAHQLEVRKRVVEGGAQPTSVIDRFWFKSVYFREPAAFFSSWQLTVPGSPSTKIVRISANRSSYRPGLNLIELRSKLVCQNLHRLALTPEIPDGKTRRECQKNLDTTP